MRSIILIILIILINGCASKREEITKKIIKVETSHGGYTTVNKKSGAYGRYQIMPKTARHYTNKLNMPHNEWKRPKNQDKIYQAILDDNIETLKKNGFEVNAFNVYGCHQQGAYGFSCIIKNENMTKRSYTRLRRNLPKVYRNASNEELREIWIDYWQYKMK